MASLLATHRPDSPGDLRGRPEHSAASPLSVHGLTVAYQGRPVLWDVEYEAPDRQLIAIVGPNGAGKSSLIKACLGLVPKASGTVEVHGRPVERQRRLIGYVPQRSSVDWDFPVSALEVVAMGRYGAPRPRTRALDHQAVDEAIERLELGDLARRYLDELSGGQRQRVLVAQGLAQRAEVLLLDEPLSGLDLASAERIAAIVAEERAAGRAVVVATHDLADAAGADRAVLLAGRVVAAGPPVDVVTREHLSKAYGDRLVRVADDLLIVDDGAHRGGGDHCGEHR